MPTPATLAAGNATRGHPRIDVLASCAATAARCVMPPGWPATSSD